MAVNSAIQLHRQVGSSRELSAAKPDGKALQIWKRATASATVDMRKLGKAPAASLKQRLDESMTVKQKLEKDLEKSKADREILEEKLNIHKAAKEKEESLESRIVSQLKVFLQETLQNYVPISADNPQSAPEVELPVPEDVAKCAGRAVKVNVQKIVPK